MIKTVIFDWGGVLMRTVDIRPRQAWERQLGLQPGELAYLFFRSPTWKSAQLGASTLEEVWGEMARHLGIGEEKVAILQQDFWGGDQLDQEMGTLIRKLRAEGVRTALLSNHDASLSQRLTDLDMDDLFDSIIISALEGVMKPDPIIYRRALEALRVAPEEAIFTDDQSTNVRTARKLGMTAFRFRGVDHLRRRLAEAGMAVTPPTPKPIPGIQALIFDWGGVLSPLTFFQRTQKWEERLGLAEGTLNRILWGREWKQLEIGALPQEDFDDHVAHGLGLPDRGAVHQFYQEYYSEDHLDQRVVTVVRSLRDRYPLALLTNAFPDHAQMARERFDFDPRAEFDVYVNSAEVGMAKPDPAVYQLVLDRLGISPKEALFVDDMVRNTDAAHMLGIHTLTFTDPDPCLDDLAQMLGHPILPT